MCLHPSCPTMMGCWENERRCLQFPTESLLQPSRSCSGSEAGVCGSFGSVALPRAVPRKRRIVWGTLVFSFCFWICVGYLTVAWQRNVSPHLSISLCLLFCSRVVLLSLRSAQAGSVNVSPATLPPQEPRIIFIRPWVPSTVFVCVLCVCSALTSLFACVHVCSALGALSGPNCATKEQAHDPRGCQRPVGPNLWFHRCHQAHQRARSVEIYINILIFFIWIHNIKVFLQIYDEDKNY